MISIKEKLLDFASLFWVPTCLCCSKIPEQSDMELCNKCNESLFESFNFSFCAKCAAILENPFIAECPECSNLEFSFDKIMVAGKYNSVLRELILKFKNHRKYFLSNFLSFILRQKLESFEFSHTIDFFVPVPLHWTKEFTRGFNQSAILAEKIKSKDQPVCTDLVRIKRTKPQFTLNYNERLKNIKGAFAIRKGHPFSGKNICLVDDIKTTGATLNECAAVLKNANANKVFALVLSAAV